MKKAIALGVLGIAANCWGEIPTAVPQQVSGYQPEPCNFGKGLDRRDNRNNAFGKGNRGNSNSRKDERSTSGNGRSVERSSDKGASNNLRGGYFGGRKGYGYGNDAVERRNQGRGFSRDEDSSSGNGYGYGLGRRAERDSSIGQRFGTKRGLGNDGFER